MKKIISGLLILVFFSFSPLNAAPTEEQLLEAYKYAYDQYVFGHFDLARDTFKKIAVTSENPGLNANSLYYYAQCAFRTEDFDGCAKGMNILVKKWPNSSAVQKGFVTRFASAAIDQAVVMQTHWDYMRFRGGTDEDGKVFFKESVPPGLKIKRINFKFAFKLYRVLNMIQPDSPETLEAKKKLEQMQNAPMTLLWVDEKPVIENRWGHPGDFLSKLTLNEKKDFSKFICERMFYSWKTDRLYEFLEMYDDVRNLKPRYIARTPEIPAALPSAAISANTAPLEDELLPLTLGNVFKASGYNPYTDSYSSVVETSPTDLSL
jgi:hypothetical protein